AMATVGEDAGAAVREVLGVGDVGVGHGYPTGREAHVGQRGGGDAVAALVNERELVDVDGDGHGHSLHAGGTASRAAARAPLPALDQIGVRGPRAYPRAPAWAATANHSAPEAAPTSPNESAGVAIRPGSTRRRAARAMANPASSPRHRSPFRSQTTSST